MSDLIIELQNVKKSYKMADQTFYALKGINLKIYTNEYIAITGPSGSGKSTLMNILGCLDSVSDGAYILEGEQVSQFDEKKVANVRNRSIGFIFQSFNLMNRVSVLENIMQPLMYRFTPIKERRKQAALKLQLVGLEEKANNLPNQLSGGQRQRVAIARALVSNPSILLGDEPTGNLDSYTTDEIMKLFDELHKQGNTIILVTHEQEIADRCLRQIRLVDGCIESDVTRLA